MHNIKYVAMACMLLHNLCIARQDLCNPRWKLHVDEPSLVERNVPRQRIIQEFNLGVSSHVSITLWCELCSCFWGFFCFVLFFFGTFLLATHSNFFVLQIRSADKLSFGLNVLLPYSSYCFPYFLTVWKLFLLSLKTQQWYMPTEPRSQCFFLKAEQLIGESHSIALC